MDYNNAVIYMIEPTIDYHDGDVFYGITCSSLTKTLYQHRHNKKSCKSRILFDKYGIQNIGIMLFEVYPCNGIDQLRAQLAKVIRENKCINKFNIETSSLMI